MQPSPSLKHVRMRSIYQTTHEFDNMNNNIVLEIKCEFQYDQKSNLLYEHL
jgi:hypothetical protein